MSVRSLQLSFRRDIQTSPVAFILEMRLMQVRRELSAASNHALTVREIAERWGFVHMSDFGQRYRARFGTTPAKTRGLDEH